MNVEQAAKEAKLAFAKKVRERLSKQPLTFEELKEALNCKQAELKHALQGLKLSGANLSTLTGNRIYLDPILQQGGTLELKAEDRGDGWTVVGFVSDNHLGNKHSRLDVLEAAYDFFAAEGVKHVLNGGNWVDGEARFNRHELIVAPGMDAQLNYALEVYPQRKGITTHFISGDDHEGWWVHRECVNVGEYFQMRAERVGRHDLRYLGHVEADIKLRRGNKSVVGRIMHPGGGAAYALSYAPQKLVESFQGGEKPVLLWIGHYHKYDVCYPREVVCISLGCTTDQSAFLRKNKIGVHVGFGMTKLMQDKLDGHVTRVQHEWIPFYDRGYYEKRFG